MMAEMYRIAGSDSLLSQLQIVSSCTHTCLQA